LHDKIFHHIHVFKQQQALQWHDQAAAPVVLYLEKLKLNGGRCTTHASEHRLNIFFIIQLGDNFCTNL
jgi:hypothetical protein